MATWEVVAVNGRTSIIDREEFHKIATVHRHDEQAEFARLIAAAPEMLVALKAFVHWYAGDSTEFNRDMAFDAAEKAIAQAEGADVSLPGETIQ